MTRDRARGVIFLAGLALAVGFFLPWVDLGGPFRASGFDAFRGMQDWSAFRVMMLMVPLGGAAMMVCALVRSRYTRLVSLATGACLGAYGLYKALDVFFRVTGWGLWIVLAAGAVALIVPLLVRPAPR